MSLGQILEGGDVLPVGRQVLPVGRQVIAEKMIRTVMERK